MNNAGLIYLTPLLVIFPNAIIIQKKGHIMRIADEISEIMILLSKDLNYDPNNPNHMKAMWDCSRRISELEAKLKSKHKSPKRGI